jgi:hypothetical protein
MRFLFKKCEKSNFRLGAKTYIYITEAIAAENVLQSSRLMTMNIKPTALHQI